MGWSKIARVEGVLRVCAVLLLLVAACVVGSARQTTLVLGLFAKTATYKDINVIRILLWVVSFAAAYNLIQLASFFGLPLLQTKSYTSLAWLSLLLDQAASYVATGTVVATLESGVLSMVGQEEFGWMKMCDKYSRFCIQIGGGLLCAVIALLLLASISFVSAFRLFSLYSPTHFLRFKLKPSSYVAHSSVAP